MSDAPGRPGTGTSRPGAAWTTADEIAAKARRRWREAAEDVAADREFQPVTVSLRGPRAGEIGDDIAAVRGWIASLGRYDGSRYTLRWAAIGGRALGRNQLPTHAVIESLDQLVALLGARAELDRLRQVLAMLGDTDGPPLLWVQAHPLTAADLADEMPQLLAAYRWLDEYRESGRYLREIAAPGVDTKFTARHRGVLAAMLGVPGSAQGFVDELGLAHRPTLVRMRIAPAVRPLPHLSEIAVRSAELDQLAIAPRRALIIENEVTYLSVPVPTDGVIIWGGGYRVDAVASASWLADAAVDYWGDLDTHGFAILDRLRAHVPHVVSILMDADTLLQHRERWVSEPTPTRTELPRLTPAEQDVYAGLVTDRWGERVKLEQELIDWTWALARLSQ